MRSCLRLPNPEEFAQGKKGEGLADNRATLPTGSRGAVVRARPQRRRGCSESSRGLCTLRAGREGPAESSRGRAAWRHPSLENLALQFQLKLVSHMTGASSGLEITRRKERGKRMTSREVMGHNISLPSVSSSMIYCPASFRYALTLNLKLKEIQFLSSPCYLCPCG